MARKLPALTHERIQYMIENGGFTVRQIAADANCSRDAVKAIKRNLRNFGSTRAPARRSGRRSSITSEIRDALLAKLDKHPELYLEEMVAHIWDDFRVRVTKSSVSRTLRSAGWSKKKTRRRAVEQDQDLVDYYLHKVSGLHSWQCVFVDEPGCDRGDGCRRTAWSPRGVTPVQIEKFHRGRRYQILPAY